MTRRNGVANVSHVRCGTHTGLWFDAYISSAIKRATVTPNSKKTTKAALMEQVVELGSIGGQSALYPSYARRWMCEMETAGCRFLKVRTVTPLALNLGMESVMENGVSLHHTYGVPMLPGSSLKGLAAAYAHQRLEDARWHKETVNEEEETIPTGVLHRALFGDGDEVGAICFEDALPLVENVGAADLHRLRPDTITVHHQEYYSGTGKPPADWDSPIPSPFLSVWGTFLIPLRPTCPEYCHWLDTAQDILTQALKIEGLGLGAKTSSGYGRFEVVN